MCQPEFLSFHGGKFASGVAGHLPLSDIWNIRVPGMLVLKRKASGYPCCFSITRLCSTLCDPIDCSMPGFPVLHHLPRFVQTDVH